MARGHLNPRNRMFLSASIDIGLEEELLERIDGNRSETQGGFKECSQC